MDLGTANTIIIKDDKIVLDEPSVVAFDNRTGEMIAVGTKAREMYEKGNANDTHDQPSPWVVHSLAPYGRLYPIREHGGRDPSCP